MKKKNGYSGHFFKITVGTVTAYIYDTSAASLTRWFLHTVKDPDQDQEFLLLLASAFGSGQITAPTRYTARLRKALLEFKLEGSLRKKQ